ncbi:MAG: hypothetical protein IKB86_01435 [Clostridia bacterium]|nr:hypothetical protein [Clostridia bacterium]
MSVEKKVAYLKGLAEGLKISEDSNEGKLLLAIIDTLDYIACDLEEVDEELTQLNEYIEEVDNDLLEVEEIIFDDEDDCCDCDCCCDDDCDCDCDCCDCDDCDCDCCCDDDCDCDCCCDDDCDCDCDDEFEYQEYQCPNCNEFICFSGDFAEEELVCPKCNAKLLGE